MIQENLKGHLSAFFCVIVWGSTFVVSKDLLSVLQPLQLMLIRFSIAYIFFMDSVSEVELPTDK